MGFVAVLTVTGFVHDFVPIGLALTTTAQTTLRRSIVLLVVLLTLAAHFGLDVVLSAVLAGIVLRRRTNRTGDVEPLENKLEAVIITATTMPLLIALAAIGLSDGVMLPSNAAALVGASVVSVLVFPAVAVLIGRAGRAEVRSGQQ